MMMKKWFGILMLITVLLVSIAGDALAEETTPDSFFDWSYLATYSGAVAAVVIIVQMLKLPADRIGHIPTRLLVYVVSLIVLLMAQGFTAHSLTPDTVALAALNAVLVAFAAMGAYERVIALPEQQKHLEGEKNEAQT